MTAKDLTQAEIAGGIFKTAETCPVKGQLIRDFELSSTERRKVSISDYKGGFNLVLVFADGRPSSLEFLTGVAKAYTEIRDEEAEVLAVFECAIERATRLKGETRAPFPVLADADGRIHHVMGAHDSSGQPTMAVYITDRFGEVFAAFREAEQQSMPTAQEILGWLTFVNSQCPECSPPEWPM